MGGSVVERAKGKNKLEGMDNNIFISKGLAKKIRKTVYKEFIKTAKRLWHLLRRERTSA